MVNKNIITFAIIGVILLLLIIVIIAFAISDHKTSPTSEPPIQEGEFLSSCVTGNCGTGLICDGNTFTCKIDENYPCNSSSQCAIGFFCSGLCVTGATGDFNNFCPCLPGFTCTSVSGGVSLCKNNPGNSCTNDDDCASGFCGNNICLTAAPNAYPCIGNIDCNSFNCSNGFCQEQNVTTGVIGAACAGECIEVNGAGCNSGLACACISNVGTTAGICITPSQGISSSCSIFSPCDDTMLCANTSGEICTESLTGCICVYPYEDPNVINNQQICISAMSTTDNINCFNNSQEGCGTGSDCSSGICNNNNSVLTIFQFQLGSTAMAVNSDSIIDSITNQPVQLQPYKLFSVSDVSGDDNIYIIDKIQGLYFMICGSALDISDAHQLIPPTFPYNGGTFTLIDVSYNDEEFIFAFKQTINNVDTDVLYTNINPQIEGMQPFNNTTGTPGSQYDNNGNLLSIDYISISSSNPISSGGDVLINSNGSVYTKMSNSTVFNLAQYIGGPLNGTSITGATGPVRFYYDTIQNEQGTSPAVCPASGDSKIQCPSINNIALISNGSTGTSFPQILNFTGNIASFATPNDRFGNIQYLVYDYDIYSTPGIGMKKSNIITLSQATLNGNFIDNVIAFTVNGNTNIIPYRIDTTTKSTVTGNRFYIVSIGKCQ